MIARVAFFIMMSVGLIGFGFVAWTTTRPGPTAEAAAPAKTSILVVGQSVQGGSMLTAELLQAKDIAASDLTKEHNLDTPDIRRGLMGAMAKRSLSPGEPIRNDDVMRPSEHGFMAAVLGPGMRAVSIVLDAAGGASNLISPGDRVDLLLTQMSNDPNTPMGRRISAHTVLSNVRVVAIDSQLISLPNRNPSASSDGQNKTVTLEVDEAQAQKVAVVMRLGKLSVSVRSANSPVASGKPNGKQDVTFASDILPELADRPAPVAPIIMAAPPPRAAPPMRVFSGPNEAKDFKF